MSPSPDGQPVGGQGGGRSCAPCLCASRAASTLNPDVLIQEARPSQTGIVYCLACSPGLAAGTETTASKDLSADFEAVQLKALNCFQP